MQSRQIRKVPHGRHAEHAVGKWQDERKVHLGFIFESWKSLRDKRADTDPGLAFHLMEIHDQYCLCRFEDDPFTIVRDGDPVGSSDVTEQPEEKDEISIRCPKVSSSESNEYKNHSPSLQVSEQQQQQQPSNTEPCSRRCNSFKHPSPPVNSETFVTEQLSPSLDDSLFTDNVGSTQALSSIGYSTFKVVPADAPHIPVYPFQVTRNISDQSQDDVAHSTCTLLGASDMRVKDEPIDVDSDPDELDEHIVCVDKTDISTAVSNAEETHRDNGPQPIADRLDLPWMCHRCPKSYHSKKSLVRHVKSHDSTANFECHMCCKKFFSRWEMQQHVEAHTDSFLCAVCGKSFNWTKSLKRHYRQAHSDHKDFRCNHCNTVFKDYTGLLEHKATQCTKSFLCAQCGAEFRFQKSLRFHETKVCLKRLITREGYTFKCESCGKVFKTRRLLQQHGLMHKPPGFRCHGCGNMFTYRTSLRFHMRSCKDCLLISV